MNAARKMVAKTASAGRLRCVRKGRLTWEGLSHGFGSGLLFERRE